MSDNKKKFYITTPIFYASGKPHLGHAYTSIACDVLARWKRKTGHEVFFLTGTDEHGQKVAEKAKENKVSEQEYVDSLIPNFKKVLEKLNITNDFFIRTTNEQHKTFVQKMLTLCYEKGDIYLGEYEGLYCVGCERYYTQTELLEGNICPDHKKPCVQMKEESYFFKLSKYQDKLLELFEKNPNFLSPSQHANEIINRVKEGLRDISISRNKKTLTWGIEIPFDKNHVTYVWFDALFNYISALDMNGKMEFWPADVHLVGKEINWFHTVYWPAFLMSAGFELPKKVFAHGWWTVEGHKMSKSLGNVLDPIQLSEELGKDQLRYYLLSIGTFGDDLNFTKESFAEKINNELNNDFGNLVSRVHTLLTKYFGGSVPSAEKLDKEEVELTMSLNFFPDFDAHMSALRFKEALDLLWEKIRTVNAYINKVEPWKIQDTKRLESVLSVLTFAVQTFARYIECFMPETAQRIRKQYNFEEQDFSSFTAIPAGHKIGEKDNLFSKITLEKKAETKKEDSEKKEEKKTGFASLNLTVGEIIEVSEHPDAEKLFIEKIDLGNGDIRQIVSGLRAYYTKEEMLHKKVIVVANLKPAKLRGVRSEGMILAADDEEHVGLVLADAKMGTQISCAKLQANATTRITVDDFFAVEMKSTGKEIHYENTALKAGEKALYADRNVVGNVR